MSDTQKVLYEYDLDWSAGSYRCHIDGDRAFIEGFIRLDEFEKLFGGCMRLSDPSGKSEFLGVWGRQAISLFKRTLRQRGAEFVVVRASTQDRIVKSYTQHYGEGGR